MRDSFIVTSNDLPGVSLRTAGADDCEDLRTWKNSNRQSFFHTDPISPEQQRAWFEGYLGRPDDWMFMVEASGDRAAIGCMGFRAVEGQADVYNVILGRAEYQGRGVMAAALRLMCSFARSELGSEIVARVLTTNPAVGWYRKNGFDVLTESSTHYLIKLTDTRFTPVQTVRKELAS